MQRVFLSYTYRPHPDAEAETDLLQRTARRLIEAMDLHVVDGVDLGGRALDAEIDRRIAECDALIALYTPQADVNGAVDNPMFVITEFQNARARGKPHIRVLHHALEARGLGRAEEFVPYRPEFTLDVAMKLINTLALWKRDLGRSVQVRVEPEELCRRYDGGRDRCEYELMVNYKPQPAVATQLWHEPGGAFVHVPNLIDGAKVRVKMSVEGEQWQSAFSVPYIGGISLQKRV